MTTSTNPLETPPPGVVEMIECGRVDTSAPIGAKNLVEIRCRWWFSQEKGLTCDNPRDVEFRFRFGVRVPLFINAAMSLAFPCDGLLFFRSLPYSGGSYAPISEPELVDIQGGEPIVVPSWFRRPKPPLPVLISESDETLAAVTPLTLRGT